VKTGSFIPQQTDSVLYAMAGDDCSLHHDLRHLTPKQQVDHQENQMLTCALQVALTGLGKSNDHVALADVFSASPWLENLGHYCEMFSDVGLQTIPRSHWQFHPINDFYASVKSALPKVEMINLYMVSGSNAQLHQSAEALKISQNLNSKLHFAAHAPASEIPTPRTEIYRKKALHAGAADAFFAAHPEGVMVKLLGLAGSRNVFPVVDLDHCLRHIEEYDAQVEVLLQQKLDDTQWREMTVDLTITPDRISINNVRQILFAGGKWVGNFISPDLQVADRHREVLIRVGEYARAHGYSAPEGVNCGIDYFISGDDIIVTEINARWTGGLFPAQFINRLGVRDASVAFFDMLPFSEMERFSQFQREHLFPATDSEFSYIPMGFTPFISAIEGTENYFTWQVVSGDFAAFVAAKQAALAPGALPTADAILQEALK
jgi:hypothetical protein